jgi:hypothetical protein
MHDRIEGYHRAKTYHTYIWRLVMQPNHNSLKFKIRLCIIFSWGEKLVAPDCHLIIYLEVLNGLGVRVRDNPNPP